MPRKPRGPMFKNRIVGRGMEAPDQLLAHPANGWKIHPEFQQDEVEKVLERVGWVREVLVNKRTGYVIDGHLRVALAIRRNEEMVPVVYIDVSPEEEKLLILTLDPLAGLYGKDNDKLPSLIDEVAMDFSDIELDLAGILKTAKTPTKGLTHDVHECTCCRKKCKPGCGCYRDDE